MGLDGHSWTEDGTPNEEFVINDPGNIWNFIGYVKDCLEANAKCQSGIKDWMTKRGYRVSQDSERNFEGSYTRVYYKRGPSRFNEKEIEVTETRSKKVSLSGIRIEK